MTVEETRIVYNEVWSKIVEVIPDGVEVDTTNKVGKRILFDYGGRTFILDLSIKQEKKLD